MVRSVFHKPFYYGLLLSALIVNGITVRAQYPGFELVTNLEEFKRQFATESSRVSSIRCAFTQEKTLEVLAEKILSEGRFWFKRSNKVRMEYEKPFVYIMIMNQDKIHVRDDQKENTINVRSNKLFQQVNGIMMDAVQGTILDNKDFSIQVFENKQEFLLEMIPVAKSLKDFFTSVLIFIDRSDYSINAMEMREASGDKTLIRFTKKELNVQVKDEVFAIR